MNRYEIELTDEQARVLLEVWDNYDPGESNPEFSGKGVIADAIRANPPKPPRMAEPGWGQKVIAHTRGDNDEIWLRDTLAGPYRWVTAGQRRSAWHELIDPRPVS